MERRALTQSEIKEALQELQGWSVDDEKLFKLYKFKTFAEALGWMVSAGVYADAIDHHPDWRNVYNRVEVHLVTHDMGDKISTFDVDLAKRMEELAS